MYTYISKDDELRIEDDSQNNSVEPNTYPDNAGGGQGGFPGGGDFDYAEYGDMTDSFTRSDRNDENRYRHVYMDIHIWIFMYVYTCMYVYLHI
jgi:hypothetical protein